MKAMTTEDLKKITKMSLIIVGEKGNIYFVKEIYHNLINVECGEHIPTQPIKLTAKYLRFLKDGKENTIFCPLKDEEVKIDKKTYKKYVLRNIKKLLFG